MGQGQGQGAKFPTRTCEGYDANDGAAWGGKRRRATGAAHYERLCSADLRDRSAAALERGVGRVRWRGRRKWARNWDGGSGARGSGRDPWSLAGARAHNRRNKDVSRINYT
jgi:hypothetical protein